MALVSATQGVGGDAGKEGDVAAGFCRLHIARMHRNTLARATRAQEAGVGQNTLSSLVDEPVLRLVEALAGANVIGASAGNHRTGMDGGRGALHLWG
jgi:hypothetical protein